MSDNTPQKRSTAETGAKIRESHSSSSGQDSAAESSRTGSFTRPSGQQETFQQTQLPASANQALQANRVIAEATLNNFNDTELQEVLYRRYYSLDERGRPPMEDVINRIANVVNVVGPRGLPPREAVILLAQAGWNATMALRRYIEVFRRPDVAQEIERAQNPPPQKPKTQAEDDGDDEKPIPTGVETFEIAHPDDRSRKARAVYHHQIRRYLIERDQRRYGSYRYERTRGKDFEDQTAPHPDQLRWGFTKQRNMPPILFQYKPAGHLDPDYEWSHMWWRGHAVVDVDKVPLRDFKNLPSTLANSCEGGLMEAVERLDSRVKHQDLAGRQFSNKINTFPTPDQLKARDNRLSQQMRRFRERHGMVSWNNPRGGNDRYHQWMDDHLPPQMKAQNTTRGFPELSLRQVQEIKETHTGRSKKRPNKGEPQKPAGNLTGVSLKLERLQTMEMDQIERDWLERDVSSDSEEDDVGPDARYERPQNIEEEAELHDALLPTIYHFLRVTGELPVIPNWQRSYINILWILNRQLQLALQGRGVPSVALVGLGFWTGGIAQWRTAELEGQPLANKEAEIDRGEAERNAAIRETSEEEEDGDDDDVEMGESGDEGENSPLWTRDVR